MQGYIKAPIKLNLHSVVVIAGEGSVLSCFEDLDLFPRANTHLHISVPVLAIKKKPSLQTNKNAPNLFTKLACILNRRNKLPITAGHKKQKMVWSLWSNALKKWVTLSNTSLNCRIYFLFCVNIERVAALQCRQMKPAFQ